VVEVSPSGLHSPALLRRHLALQAAVLQRMIRLPWQLPACQGVKARSLCCEPRGAHEKTGIVFDALPFEPVSLQLPPLGGISVPQSSRLPAHKSMLPWLCGLFKTLTRGVETPKAGGRYD
jgi:hypothetical protein